MAQQFSLAHLTVLGCTPAEVVRIAARTGYDFASLRLIPIGLPEERACMPFDKEMIRQTRAALKETGIRLLDLELARILREVEPKSYLPAMEAAAEMGARHVISSAWTTQNNDREFIIERYGEICDLARPFGLTVDLEFPSISRLTTLKDTAGIVEAAGRPNGGILLDTLYVHFSRVKPAELGALPREWIHFLHVCDTQKEIPSRRDDLLRIIREGRLYLGEGSIDFGSILERLPPVPYSIELPNAKRVQELGYEGHARRCLETAKQYLNNH